MKKKLGWASICEVKFSGYSLTKSLQTKYLGIFIDENLKWDAHIKYICYKLSHISGIFVKCVDSLARMLLLFGTVLWSRTKSFTTSRMTL